MPAIILSDNGVSSGSAGLKTSGSNDGTLALQTTTAGGTATTAVTINTSQNVGLGVTPSPWSSFTALQVGPSGSVSNSGTGTPVTVLSNNAYYNGTNWVYINTATASQYQLSTSQHIWRYAASGSGNITWSEAMRLDTSGNLGVGTSSPAYRLDVAQAGATTIASAFAMARITGANSVANDLTLIGPNTSQVRINFGDTDAANVGEVGYDHSTNSLRFVTNGVQRAVFDGSGNFLVGTTSAGSLAASGRGLIEVNGTTDSAFGMEANNTLYGYLYNSASEFRVANVTANPVTFFTNNTERARIDSSGNFLIGTTTNIGSARTSIVNASGVTLNLEKAGGSSLQFTYAGGTTDAQIAGGGSGSLLFYTGNTLSERARIDSSGNFLVGTTDGTSGGLANFIKVNGSSNPGYIISKSGGNVGYLWYYDAGSTVRLECNNSNKTNSISVVANTGGVQLSSGATAWTSLSDENTKTDLLPITGAVQKISSLRAVTGRFKTDAEEKRRAFLIAQDVQSVLPEAVNTYTEKDGTEYLGLSYTDTIPLLVAAIKEQQAIIAQLQADVATLKGTP